jgi:starch synthase (maltosyl-transferring)
MSVAPRIYNLFPSLAGSITAWTGHVPRIAAMNFDWIYVNPFHQTGSSGSLYAVRDYYTIDPRFGESPTDLRGFIDACAKAGIRVMMDLVVNHSARDATLVKEHPDWYAREAGGAIISPGASDPANPSKRTVWADLAEFDYAKNGGPLTAYFAGVIRYYLSLGIAGFRCDAAYKVPPPVWRALIDQARAVRPDVVFAAENLGAPMEDVLLLRDAGFDYLFNSAKWWDFRSDWLLEQYAAFRTIAPSIAFPESHDTDRLRTELGAALAPAALAARYVFRYAFAATFSSGVMMPMGYEFGFEHKLDVVRTEATSWEQPAFDISADVANLNAMRTTIPALNEEGLQRGYAIDGDVVALVRHTNDGADVSVSVLNASAQARTVQAASIIADSERLIEFTPGSRAGMPPQIEIGPYELRIFAAPRDRVAQDSPKKKKHKESARRAAVCVIEAITPNVEAGRFAAKRIDGERVVVEADVFREGHDAVAAVVRYRPEQAVFWFETAMHPIGNDRWAADFIAGPIGKMEYAVEAWPDTFETWHHDTSIKRAAGVAIAFEAIEGRALVAEALERATKDDRPLLQAVLTRIDAAAPEDRIAVLLDHETRRLVRASPDRSFATRSESLPLTVDRSRARTGAWYEFFPRSQSSVPGRHGTFADAALQLRRIRALGFDVVYLPPVHPIGHAFRKGKNNSLEAGPDDPGSPWAIGNEDGGHCSIEPKLGTLADFDAFVAAANAEGLEVALDYALQCSSDHPYVREHPEWFTVRPDGSIKYAENPPKKYQDIVNFNWFGKHASALWKELRDIVLFWIGHGVRIFRVDNPHTKPFAYWEWMIGEVKERHPGVIFLAEAFTRPKIMNELAKVGFTQSYTYFTWRNLKQELIDYVVELTTPPVADYYRPNFFANTPDILPPFLQTGGRPAFIIRLFLAATLSGAYGIYSGYEICENAALPGREEYDRSEKYELRYRDWDAPGNINAEIIAINGIRRSNPALQDWRNTRFLAADNDRVLFFEKRSGSNTLLVAICLDPFAAAYVSLALPLDDLGIAYDESFRAENVLTGERFIWRGPFVAWYFEPTRNPAAIFRIERMPRAELTELG